MTSPKILSGDGKALLAITESQPATREVLPPHIPSISQELGQIVCMTPHVDERGALLAFDYSSLPFVPRRAFTVTQVPKGTVRGQHAHRKASQLLICLSGRVRVDLWRDVKRTTLDLDDPATGLVVLPGTYASQTYLLPQTTLLVFANEPYDPDDYIHHAG